jgi:hypothetical protein
MQGERRFSTHRVYCCHPAWLCTFYHAVSLVDFQAFILYFYSIGYDWSVPPTMRLKRHEVIMQTKIKTILLVIGCVFLWLILQSFTGVPMKM